MVPVCQKLCSVAFNYCATVIPTTVRPGVGTSNFDPQSSSKCSNRNYSGRLTSCSIYHRSMKSDMPWEIHTTVVIHSIFILIWSYHIIDPSEASKRNSNLERGSPQFSEPLLNLDRSKHANHSSSIPEWTKWRGRIRSAEGCQGLTDAGDWFARMKVGMGLLLVPLAMLALLVGSAQSSSVDEECSVELYDRIFQPSLSQMKTPYALVEFCASW